MSVLPTLTLEPSAGARFRHLGIFDPERRLYELENELQRIREPDRTGPSNSEEGELDG